MIIYKAVRSGIEVIMLSSGEVSTTAADSHGWGLPGVHKIVEMHTGSGHTSACGGWERYVCEDAHTSLAPVLLY